MRVARERGTARIDARRRRSDRLAAALPLHQAGSLRSPTCDLGPWTRGRRWRQPFNILDSSELSNRKKLHPNGIQPAPCTTISLQPIVMNRMGYGPTIAVSEAMAHSPTRAEFERLKAECEELRTCVDSLVEQMQQVAKDAQIQFQRIAQIQAVLDEEWRHDTEESSHHVSSHTTGDGPPVMPTVPYRSHRRRRSVG